MGLDVTHDCWHGAYSAFGRFREQLALKIGVNLNMMEGFWRMRDYLRPDAPDRMGPPMKWEALKPDPLHILLNHSDCEGIIAHADCAPLAKRLREIAKEFEPGFAAGGHLIGVREACLTFAEGLNKADEEGEDVEFH
jgi:hypothetical protein